MKRILLFVVLITNCCLSYSQRETVLDSLAMESRKKADYVLSQIDSSANKAILYSLEDRDYYVIIQRDNGFQEWAVSTDGFYSILDERVIDKEKEIAFLKAKKRLSSKEKKQLSRLESDREALNNAFDTSMYCSGLRTTIPDVTHVMGPPSYFVMKDQDGNRYGEYYLSFFIAPCPINPGLYAYLIRSIIENLNH